MLFYVAGPYSAERPLQIMDNIRAAMKVGTALLKKGHYPMIPHLTHYWHCEAVGTGCHIPWEKWLELDLKWLEVADALFFIAPSPGATRELEKAYEWGKQVYLDLKEVPNG